MPITTRIPIRRLSQAEFGDIAYEVMLHVFAIHNEIGRFFDEKITGFERSLDEFETHARRLLAHVDLRCRLGQHQHETGHLHNPDTITYFFAPHFFASSSHWQKNRGQKNETHFVALSGSSWWDCLPRTIE